MTMNQVYEKVLKCYESIKERIPFQPRVALVLGSGLGNYADSMDVRGEIGYDESQDVPVVCMKGRVHYYEGYPITDVVLPARLMKLMGAEILFLTNASGGINPSFTAGSFMLIQDHISCFAPNPLIGANIEEFGCRFPDMSKVYDPQLQEVIRAKAEECNIPLKEGIYVQLTGPSFESPAEIRMLRTLGADAVGMSTVVEAIAANHMGMRICGISCVANLAAGMTDNPLTHEEVQAASNQAAPLFRQLVTESIGAF